MHGCDRRKRRKKKFNCRSKSIGHRVGQKMNFVTIQIITNNFVTRFVCHLFNIKLRDITAK